MDTRKAIAEIVDRLPAEALTESLRHLKEIDEREVRKRLVAAHLKDIMEENRGLLQRLAQ